MRFSDPSFALTSARAAPPMLTPPRASATAARLTAAALLGLAALSLGACANPRSEEALTTGSINLDGYKTRHPIVLAESAETIDIPVGQSSGRLTPRMAHTVSVFAENARRSGAYGVTILLPSGSPNEAAANHMASQIAAALAQGGISRNGISREPYEANDGAADAPIRLAYSKVKAVVQHRCGVWPNAVGGGNFENKDDWEFGCSTQTNIAAMVVNPEDLVTPTGEDPVDGTRRTKIIIKYRDGQPTKGDTGAKGTSIADGVQGGN